MKRLLRIVIIVALLAYVAFQVPKIINHLSHSRKNYETEELKIRSLYQKLNIEDSLSGIIIMVYNPQTMRNDPNTVYIEICDSIFKGFAVDPYSNMEYSNFESSMAVNDSIYKAPNSDTIIIVNRSGKIIKWVFDEKWTNKLYINK